MLRSEDNSQARTRILDRCLDRCRSANRVEWGYNGNGPDQLAFALLYDALLGMETPEGIPDS